MEELKTYRLADICNSIQTGPFGSQLHKSDYVEFGTPIVMPKDITNGKINDNNISRISKNDVARLFKHKLVPGNIIYPRRGDISKCALITSKEDGWVCGTGCIKVDINQQIANSTYVMYVLCQSETVNWIESNAVGTTMLNLNTSILSDLPIKLPSLNTQKKLANIVSSFDKKIALNRRINDNLEQQAQALFKSWFVDFEPFGSGSMPDDWEICEAQKYFKINIGKTPPRNETKWFSKNIDDYKWASIADLGKCGLFISNTSEYLTKEAVNTFNIIIVPKGTVLLSFKLTLGRTAITTCPLTTNEAIARFLVNNDYEREYLYLLLRQYDYTSLGNTSSIATAVNSKIIKNMPIMMPPIDILQQFHTVVSPLFNRMQSLSDELTQLAETRDTLLPRLMSGELKISETETQTTNHG